ncbi:SRC kinase signaling inhibitor 1 isoform X2 [Globicephala melas]|uniref:SRC kinase signaling inhibitor 1 isoform X2 n=1 Tax=Globicephala melas TaxID=9731 RepID=UPI00293D8D70|nr:SRC kinase signaling inhibitor 1 isoform X2 [Globicephala melas]
MQPWQCLRRFALAWWERTAEGSARSSREEAGPRDPGGRGEPGLQRAAGGKPPGLCSLCLKSPDPERSSPPMLSADDAEYPREYRTLGGGGGGGGSGGRRFSNVGLVHTSERRHTVIAAQSLEALSGLQKADADRKRDAFMDHLKSKYPQHALALRSQQDRMREQVGGWTVDPVCLLSSLCSHLHGDSAPSGAGQPAQPNYWSFKTRSSRHTQGAQPGLADQAAKLSYASAESLETMSEAELPLGFSRMNRFRQSLPLSRSTSQTKLRSPGVLFLQFGEETRRVHITHEVSSLDTLHALIAHMFPQKLTMGMLKSPNTAILIKDEARNVFYELEDVRDIQDRSIIKIYRKEPLYAAFPGSHLTNGDLRPCPVRGLCSAQREMVYASRESSPTRRLNNLSPAPHLASSSPPPGLPSGLPSGSPSRSRLSYAGGRPPSYAGSPVHHAAERLGSAPAAPGVSPSPSAILERRDVKPDEDLAGKAGGMVLVKGEGLYADPYGLLHEGRLSLAAAAGDPFAYPGAGGLYKRGSVRSLSTYSAAALQSDLEDSLYKAAAGGGPLYGDGYGFRLPPSSPQKLADVAAPPGGPPPPHSPYSGPPSRGSPVRQSFRKDSGSSSVFAESPGGKTRSTGGSSTAGVPPPELFPGPGERPLVGFGPPVPAKDTETRERMEAMEKQIASLTGLVQSALLRGSEPETPSEKIEGSNGAATPSAPCGSGSRSSGATPVSGPPPPSASSTPAGQPTAINRLQMQLHLRGLQNSTNDLRSQLQQLRKLQLQNLESLRALLKGTEAELSMRVSEAARRQEDPLQRQRTLVEEERLRYLNDEELITQQLNDLEKSVEKIQRDVSHNHRLVPGPELEEKALVLKQLGETLTELKAHFPGLQSKMRVVLRVEVEAVKFLKEEPQRLDGLLKRCRGVTDTLAQIRRQVDEGAWPPPSNLLNQSPKKVTAETDFNKSLDFEMPPPSPPLKLHEMSGQTEGAPSTPKAGNPTKGLDTPGKRSVDKAVSVEAAERDWEEKRAALTQYSAKDINRLLEETQAELLKAIPDLDCGSKAHPGPAPTPDHKPPKLPHGQKATPRTEPSGRRGSDELTVPRYRTEKPSKSPPPPPPRRSFPSSHGLTTTRTGEVVVTSKKDSAFIKKAESEELEVQKPQVKLRRAVSEVARPSSTPPIMASAVKDEDDEDRIIAELEVFERSSVSPLPPTPCRQPIPTLLFPQDPGPPGGSAPGPTWKAAAGRRPFCVPRIILTECAPKPPSPPEARLEEPGLRTTPTPRPRTLAGSGRGWGNPRAPPGLMAEVSQPGNSSMLEKEGPALKRLGTGSYSPEKGGAGVPCSRGPAPDRTQEPSAAETYPEETLKDSGHNAQPCSGDCRGQRAAGLGCTGHGATTQRMDSLEETLRELEATLSQMGTAPAAGSPGSPPPPPPGPQVAASCPVLSSYLPVPVFRAGGSGRLQEHHASPLLPLAFSQPRPPPGSPVPGWVCRQSPWQAGKLACPGISPTSHGGDQGLSLCSVSVNRQIKFFPPSASPRSPPPLLSDSLCLCCFSACAALLGRPGPWGGSRGLDLSISRETSPPSSHSEEDVGLGLPVLLCLPL